MKHRATGNPRGRPRRISLDIDTRILEIIRRNVNKETGLALPQWKSMARELSVSRSTIARRTAALRASGKVTSVIIRTGPRTAVSYYRLDDA